MPTPIKIFATIIVVAFGVVNTTTQKEMKEGRIVYQITNIDSAGKKSIDQSKVEEITLRFHNNKQRIDIHNTGDDPHSWLYDMNTFEQCLLMSYKGTFYADTNRQDYVSGRFHNTHSSDFVYLKEKKTICGYKCFKAEYKVLDDSLIHYVYYTKDISAPLVYYDYLNFKDLKGYPMEYNGYEENQQFISTIKYIGIEKIDDTIFKIPEGYKIRANGK